MAACLGVRSGRLDGLPFWAGPIRILCRSSAMLLDTLLDDAVRYRYHPIHQRREAFVLD